MPTHSRRWRKNSEFGPGLRIPMDRERRAVWLARLELHRRGRRLTPTHALVARAMLKRLGTDGRLDPSHATLADDIGASVRTVQRALERLAECGLVTWCRRIIRIGARGVEQTSNAYAITLGDVPEFPAFPSKRQTGRLTPRLFNDRGQVKAPEPPPEAVAEARAALAGLAEASTARFRAGWLRRKAG